MDSNKNMPTAPPSYADSMNPVQTSMYPSINIDHNIPVGVPQMEAPQQPTQVIVVQQTNSVPPLGPNPVQLSCPTCKSLVVTSVENEASSTAYLCCLMMCILQLYCCSCVPLCMDGFQVVKHSCPRCGAFVGQYKP